MKYIIILVLLLLSCLASNTENTESPKNSWRLSEYYYDGCQYIANAQGLTHKGNCSNSYHK